MTSLAVQIVEGPTIEGTLTYDEDDQAFNTSPRPDSCGSSIMINFIELMLDDEESRHVVFVTGYCPSRGWKPAALTPPRGRQGRLLINTESQYLRGSYRGPRNDGMPVFVNHDNGWVVLGDPETARRGEAVQFAPGATVVVESGAIISLWLQPAKLPPLAQTR